MGNMYVSRRNPVHGWRAPQHLACAPAGPNSALDEQGPSYVEMGGDSEQLFFWRSSGTVSGDLFVSTSEGDNFGAAAPVSELNSPGNDIQPNVCARTDLYGAARASTDDRWGPPVNLGPEINTPAAESRPSLSWGGRTLLFGRAPGPEGS